jgi:Putative zinc-finger
MKWQCALLQRWLPEYPDGDLPAWGKRWLTSHVARCSACRRELAELLEAVAAMTATPVADPGPEFWGDFSREMHLKLVQAAQNPQAAPAPAPRRWFRLPYLLGAPAVAVLLLYVAVQFTGLGVPLQKQAALTPPPAAKMAAVPRKAPAPQAALPAAPIQPAERIVSVSLEEVAPLTEEEMDISGFDLDAELAGMTDQEKNAFLNNLHQRKKDGSCFEAYSLCSWG